MIKLPLFKEKKCSYLFNNFVCWGCATSQTPQLFLEKTQLVCQRLPMLGFFPVCKNVL